MDELERDLRSTFDRLADDAMPSDGLVERTIDRSVQIRRQRHLLTGAGVAGAFATVVIVASLAGAATRGAHVQVTTPPVVELPSTTTTAPASPTTAATPGPPATKGSTSGSTAATAQTTTTTTIPAACVPPVVIDDTVTDSNGGNFTLLADGNIRVDYIFIFGPARESHRFVLDDGTRGDSGFTKVYTPAEFGSHGYDEWTVVGVDGQFPTCREHHNYVVDPATATPDTTPTPTTVPDRITVPDSTTVPVTPTTGG